MRSRFIAAGVAVSAALALVPAAGAQGVEDDADTVVADDQADDQDNDQAGEPSGDQTDDQAGDQTDDQTDEPTDDQDDEPTTPPAPPRIAVEARVEANGATQIVDVARIDEVSNSLPANTPVRWTFDGNRPDAALALTADGRLYVTPPTAGPAKIPVLAVDTVTEQPVLAVDVTINAVAPDKSNNPDSTRQPTTGKDIAIIAGSVLGVLGLLAAMVQLLVPGGWGRVIEFYT